MRVLFTRSGTLLSRLIRAITGEDCSHCALQVEDAVIHSNLLGPHVTSYDEFTSTVQVVHTAEIPYDEAKLFHLLSHSRLFGYDFGALLYLGLRALFPFLPKANLWQTTGMYLCTEWVTEYLDGTEDSMITPYQLYQRLVNSGRTST